ncbi:MAG: pentapeptide repeat-containing protein, partial [Myxococcota bacterium]
MDVKLRWIHHENGPECREAVVKALTAGEPDWEKHLKGFHRVQEIYNSRDLRGIDLEGLDLRKAKLDNTRLELANLSKCNLKGVSVQNCDAQDALLQSANLDGIN